MKFKSPYEKQADLFKRNLVAGSQVLECIPVQEDCSNKILERVRVPEECLLVQGCCLNDTEERVHKIKEPVGDQA